MKPWQREQWCIPPEANAEFVWQMEDVLAVYTRPADPARPVVCLDETSRQLLADTRPPQPPAPGRPAREDAEYERAGVVNLFLMTEPLRGWRAVRVSDQRTRLDWADCIQELVDVHYPAAKRLTAQLEIHHPPRHGSWLNRAEIELSILQRQCLDRRLGDRARIEREVAAWVAERNGADRRIDWRFTTSDARIKLKHLYPTLHEGQTTQRRRQEFGGVWLDVRRSFAAPQLAGLYPALDAMNQFRNKHVAHVDEPLTDGDAAEVAMKQWIVGLVQLYQVVYGPL